MSSWLGKFHEFTKKYDPAGHYAIDHAWKSSTKLVNETSRGLQNWGDKWGINTDIPEYGKNLSEKDKNSFSRWGENTIGVAGLIYGGLSALGEAGSGAAGGSAGGGAAGGAAAVGGGGAAAGGGGAAAGGAYTEAGGAVVSDAAGGGFTWTGSGGGLGSTGAGGSGSTGVLGQGGAGFNWQKMMQGMSQGQQQQPQQKPLDQEKWEDPEKVRLEGDLTLSSKKLKVPARRGLSDLPRHNMAVKSEIDRNGAEIDRIKQLTKRVVHLRKMVNQLKEAA